HHRVHQLRRADDRIHRAGADAQRAADAARLVYQRDAARSLDAVPRVERLRFPAEQRRELADPGFATGRALVDVGLAGRDRLGVAPAARVAALGALRLRQQRVDALGQRAHVAASPRTIRPTRSGPRYTRAV